MSTFSEQVKEFNLLNERRKRRGLSKEERFLWLDLKKKIEEKIYHKSFPIDKDLRESLRIPTKIKVTFNTEKGISEGTITTIGEGGVFIETDDISLPFNSKIRLNLNLEDVKEELQLDGEVLWIKKGTPLEGLHKTSGIGVRFINLTPEKYKTLSELLDNLLEEFVKKWDKGESYVK